MANITTAIEIKGDILRVLQLKKGVRDISLTGYVEEKLPFMPSLDLDENVDLIIAKLRILLQNLPHKSKNTVFIIPTSQVMLRFFDLPFLSKKEREEAIKYEAQKYIPFAIDDIASDFYIPYEIKGKEMRVVYMAVKHGTLNKYVRIASSLGVKLSAIEPYPFSLLRALFTSGALKMKDFALVIDLDYSGSTILVTQGLNLYIARDFIVSPVSEITSAQVLNKIVFEINRTIDYMIKEFPHQSINEIILTGEVANEEIRESLMSMLNLNVKLTSLSGKISSSQPEVLKKYTGLAGAGLRDLISYDIDLDFFADYRGKIQQGSHFSFKDLMPRELVRDLFLLAIGAFITGAYLMRQMESIRDMEYAIHLSRSVSMSSEKVIKQEMKEIEKKIQSFNGILKGKRNFTDIFNFVPQNLTMGVWLESLELSVSSQGQKVLRMEGFGYTGASQGVGVIYQLLEAINESKESKEIFEEIKITNVEKTKLRDFDVIKFSMQMIVK
ncbi:MAG: pilus assembly protein PilM [Candidatus Saelkia tenebricola]|nr:pilus assembly protein PilM [Candidatus Saelkia tenebricola]